MILIGGLMSSAFIAACSSGGTEGGAVSASASRTGSGSPPASGSGSGSGTVDVSADGYEPPEGDPIATPRSQRAYDVEDAFTARWTRADARQISAQSDRDTPPAGNSLPERLTMPSVPEDFPETNLDVWVWDTWSLADETSKQFSFRGWQVAFALTADRHAGYSFDERHVNARIGLFYRRADVPASQRPENGGWIYGGHVFPEGATAALFAGQTFTQQAEWSGCARIYDDNRLVLFYTDVAFNRGVDEEGNPVDLTPADARIALSEGRIFADDERVWLTGFEEQVELLRPDGKWYQNGEQNNYYNFRDPYVFVDPAYPGRTFMVFEGNTAVERGSKSCTREDLGYQEGDPAAESLDAVNDSEAVLHQANVGLAEADNEELTRWHFLPPILSANCVNDQTERPQIYVQDGKRYLFIISHRATFGAGVDGPDGLYGFVGDGIRSDYQPLNQSGLVLGNPTDLTTPHGTSANILPNENPNAYQAYSHFVMPGGYVQSFIDAVGERRGGSFAPTVRLLIDGERTELDASYGDGGLGGYGDIVTSEDFPERTASR
jgi:levansucrase